MLPLGQPITQDLVSDFVAGLLDEDDAQVVRHAMQADHRVATAVAAAQAIDQRLRANLLRAKAADIAPSARAEVVNP